MVTWASLSELDGAGIGVYSDAHATLKPVGVLSAPFAAQLLLIVTTMSDDAQTDDVEALSPAFTQKPLTSKQRLKSCRFTLINVTIRDVINATSQALAVRRLHLT